MPIRLLGLMGVQDGDHEIALGPPRHRALFAQLVLQRNSAVPTEALAEGLWGGAEPSSWRAQVQSAVSALRRVLSPLTWIELRTVPAGYCLAVADEQVDLGVFDDLLARAERTTTSTLTLLREALGLWSGQALTGVHSPFADAARIQLDERRLTAYERLADASIAEGRPDTVVAELTTLVAEHPFRERLRSRLMLALAQSGRQADALQLAVEGRTVLRDELGVDPGPELREAQRAVLAGDLGPAAVVPAQLPAEAAAFVSRAAELTELEQAMGLHRVLVLSGPGGAGKSALAVLFAHRIAAQFPDGQLYVDLRGFSMGPEPLHSLEVVRRFLRAFGVGRDQLPDDLAEGEAKLRSVLAGRRVLLVLDNARDVDQVRPLLPGTDGCLVLVTSRSELRSLVVRETAHRVTVGELSSIDSLDLVSRLAGASRPAAEPAAAAAIVAACGGMPLALRIVGELIGRRRDQPLAGLAADLRDAGRRLDLLETGDGASDASVRTVTSWSYHALPDDSARFFRLLGVHPGLTFDTTAAAWLTGTEPDAARRELDLLASLHLVEPTVAGRYRLHDLLRVYAAERAASEDPGGETTAARERLTRWYLCATNAAVDVVQQPLWYWELPADLPTPPTFAGTEHARAWLEREWDSLLAVLGMIAERPADGLTRVLAERVGRFADQQHTHAETADIYQIALAVAERDGDVDGQRVALQGLAAAAGRSGDMDTFFHRLHRLLALCDDDTSLRVRGDTLNNLGAVHNFRGELDRAVEYFEAALAVYPDAGHERVRLATVGNLGIVQWKRGLRADAEHYLTEAAKLAHEFGSRQQEALQLANLAELQLGSGLPGAAAENARHAVQLAERAGSTRPRLLAETVLAEALLESGDIDAAQECIDRVSAANTESDTTELQLHLERVRGACSERRGDYEQALTHYRSCLQTADLVGDRYTEAQVWICIARTERATNRTRVALEAARNATELAERFGFGLLADRAKTMLS